MKSFELADLLARRAAQGDPYVVLAGRSLFTAGDETRSVKPGDTIFVPADMAHHFHAIGEELKLIVVFTPPEGSAQAR